MDINGSRILILGGAGLVGMAITRRMLKHHSPDTIFITSLFQKEVDDALEEVKEFSGTTKVIGSSGNVFVREGFKHLGRHEILEDDERRTRLINDTLDPLDDDICLSNALYKLIQDTKPNIIVDCINTATALAYQDIFEQSRSLYKMMQQQASAKDSSIEKHMEVLLANQYTPQLIRHVQILWRSLNDAGVKSYLKIGTTGTGGMGLNIPYTHSEDKPSRVLLAKSAMAGAHSMLLFLLGRTAPEAEEKDKKWSGDRNVKPTAPIIKEIKPAAAIAWKKIDFDPVKRRGQLIELFDHDPEKSLDFNSSLTPTEKPWTALKEGSETAYLKAPFIDTGENGIFSKGEFESITDEGQMEFITPEEIASDVEQEILGGNSGSDIVSALDSTVLGPTYRAGFLRARALESLRLLEKKHGIPSIAFENLGPPRLTKLLFEIYMIRMGDYSNIFEESSMSPEELSKDLEKQILSDDKLRAYILSVGIAVVLPNERVLRGPRLVIPSKWDIPEDRELSQDDLNLYCHQGWVDLRVSNMSKWLERFASIRKETSELQGHTGSLFVRNKTFWERADRHESLGNIASWIFLKEDDGERIKR